MDEPVTPATGMVSFCWFTSMICRWLLAFTVFNSANGERVCGVNEYIVPSQRIRKLVRLRLHRNEMQANHNSKKSALHM